MDKRVKKTGGPHLLVAIRDSDIRSDVDGMGRTPGKFKSGDPKWLPGGYSRILTNVGKDPARFVTAESLSGTIYARGITRS
jgi:hypothetical protein